MRWLFNLIWLTLLLAISPVIAWRMLRHGRYRRGFAARVLGRVTTPSGNRPCVWFHAVSVGELIQLQKVIDSFAEATANRFELVVSVSTDSAFDLAQERLTGCHVIWFPLDFTWSVAAAVRRIRPRAVVLMELELWPNLIAECRRRNIPVALINARMSPRSFRGYRRVRPLIRPLLQSLSLIAVQSQEYAERFLSLGADPESVVPTGSVKFDGVAADRRNPRTVALRESFGLQPNDLVLIAGSTQPPEELRVLRSWLQLRKTVPQLRLILVPRHRERFDDVAALIEQHGIRVVRRTRCRESCPATQHRVSRDAVGLLDTIGELAHCWGLADIAFVGGSFGSRGGQNMIEPAAFGAAIVFGPNTWNFRDVVAAFREHDACRQVDSFAALHQTFMTLTADHARRMQLGTAASRVVFQHQGATRRTVAALTALPELSNAAHETSTAQRDAA